MNMSYCRFRNTLNDLRDCDKNLYDKLSGDEFDARAQLIELCEQIVDASRNYEFEESDEE